MRIDELVDGLIDPNAVEEAPAAEMPEAEDEDDEDAEDEEGGAGAASASLLQLKTDALERFKIIKGVHAKMQKLLPSKGPHDKAYLKLLQQVSDELMNIRFTSRSLRTENPANLCGPRQDAAPAFHPVLPGQ
jgi:RNA polymerase primary sigma factor